MMPEASTEPLFLDEPEVQSALEAAYERGLRDGIREGCPTAKIIAMVLELLTRGGASRKTIGARALALQFDIRASSCKSQNELARRMGVTPTRVSQIFTELREGMSLILPDENHFDEN